MKSFDEEEDSYFSRFHLLVLILSRFKLCKFFFVISLVMLAQTGVVEVLLGTLLVEESALEGLPHCAVFMGLLMLLQIRPGCKTFISKFALIRLFSCMNSLVTD